MRARVLVIDDRESARKLVRRVLEPKGYEVLEADGVEAALAVVVKERLDAVLSDLMMPGLDGLEGLTRIRAIDPRLPVLIVTAFATVDTALDAMRAGAFDYLQKPLDPGALEVAVGRAVAHRALLDENERLREQVSGVRPAPRFIVGSPAMLDLLRLVERVAVTDVPVLVEGASGTGKELVARRIHELSRRRDKPFLSLNCAAIPESLLESELFGHEKGAFSGAVEARRGFFAEAAGGTLFLDEIGDMSLALQPKLLRVLQEGEYYRLGEAKARKADARIVCATNLHLKAQVEAGRFRADLYYRIDHARIRIPPLAERREDIPLLAAHFLERARARFGGAASRLTDEAMAALVAYPFPGNVRELEAVVERACLNATTTEIGLADLPGEILGRPSRPPAAAGGAPALAGEMLPFRAAREAFEEQYFRELMARTGGSVAKAARIAEVHRATLYEKLTRLGIEKSDD